MDSTVQRLYGMVEAYWIWDWPPISWVVALLLAAILATAIVLARWLLLPVRSWGGFRERASSTDPDELD